jgi:UDP-glucuronate decarboxylase
MIGRVVSNLSSRHSAAITSPFTATAGKPVRSVYVDDLIDGMIRLMATPDSITGPINIGNPTEFTILQLAPLVVEMTGARSKIVHRPQNPRMMQDSGNRIFLNPRTY